MTRHIKRSFTAEAVVVGIIFSLVFGLIVGLALGLLFKDAVVGLVAGAIVTLFSMDVIFRGTND